MARQTAEYLIEEFRPNNYDINMQFITHLIRILSSHGYRVIKCTIEESRATPTQIIFFARYFARSNFLIIK